jgi:hypothetical protein
VNEIHSRRSIRRANRALRLSKQFLKEVRSSVNTLLLPRTVADSGYQMLPTFRSKSFFADEIIGQDEIGDEDLSDTLPATMSSESEKFGLSAHESDDSDEDYPDPLVAAEMDDELAQAVGAIVEFL